VELAKLAIGLNFGIGRMIAEVHAHACTIRKVFMDEISCGGSGSAGRHLSAGPTIILCSNLQRRLQQDSIGTAQREWKRRMNVVKRCSGIGCLFWGP
jgi:hypothetical protein